VFEFSLINQIRGVDGYVIFDEDTNILDKDIQNNDLELEKLKTLFQATLLNQAMLNPLNTTFLLAEKGVTLVSKIHSSYIMILGGHKESVDIAKLNSLIDIIRLELENFKKEHSEEEI
jgi:hypothetical protein